MNSKEHRGLEAVSSLRCAVYEQIRDGLRLISDQNEIVELAAEIAEELYWDLFDADNAEMPSHRDIQKKVTRIRGCLQGKLIESTLDDITVCLSKVESADISADVKI